LRQRTTKSTSENPRKHADEVHPEQGSTDEQLRSIIEENVYDK
jgi:predicted outer membrane protein